MCKLKSGIILKDKVFVPYYDRHTKMLEELKISDTLKMLINYTFARSLYHLTETSLVQFMMTRILFRIRL